ncbi:hypothetical protein MMC26_003312 [Xylographa opegraphella]|nr:hypothetical protein [Xylographa opegraphella]
MFLPPHAYTHSASLTHSQAMAQAENYIQKVQGYNKASYGPDRGTFQKDIATERKSGWTRAYWATIGSQVHVALKITEMAAYPVEVNDVKPPATSADEMDSSDGSSVSDESGGLGLEGKLASLSI